MNARPLAPFLVSLLLACAPKDPARDILALTNARVLDGNGGKGAVFEVRLPAVAEVDSHSPRRPEGEEDQKKKTNAPMHAT